MNTRLNSDELDVYIRQHARGPEEVQVMQITARRHMQAAGLIQDLYRGGRFLNPGMERMAGEA